MTSLGRFLAAAVVCVGATTSLTGQDTTRGREIYERWCAECHGMRGAGDGAAAAFMLPRPRDFTRAVYQIRTTASGDIPTLDDMRRVVDEGMPGTAMPGWRGRLSAGDRDAVIAYIQSFSRFFAQGSPEPLTFGRAPGGGADALAEGAEVFQTLECFKCHGAAGRGDGQSAPTLTDDWDHPIRPADLTQPWRFNGGATVEDVYRRLRTGLDGTPMPSFSDAVEGGVVTDEQLWRVAQYVHSLGPERAPPVREVIRAALVQTVPTRPDDPDWAAIAPAWVPLGGQIIVSPRWFSPTVSGLWVQAAHDGTTLALRVSWHDPSRSPDPAWDEWVGRVAATMTDVDGPISTTQMPDRLHVQWPAMATDGAQRPFFLGGSSRDPVVLWAWDAAAGVVAGTARGLGTLQPGGDGSLSALADWADGAWALQLTRALALPDSTQFPRFTPGASVPVAFYAADGSNGENAVRGAVSAWYAIYLDVPTPPTVYVAPLLAALLTAGLGVMIIRRAQRPGRDA